MKGIQTLKRRLFLAVNCFLCSQNRNFAGKYLKISKPFKVSLTRKKNKKNKKIPHSDIREM